MSENDFESPGDAPLFARPRAFDTILYGGLVVGILDMVFAFTFTPDIGRTAIANFQSVAAGLLGRTPRIKADPDFHARYSASLCGCGLHRHSLLPGKPGLPVLIRHAVVQRWVYGMIAYLGMNYLVVPLSGIGEDLHRCRYYFLTELLDTLSWLVALALLARRSAEGSNH